MNLHPMKGGSAVHDNPLGTYETTEFKIISDSDEHAGNGKIASHSNLDGKLLKNGVYYHEPSGSKSFSVGTAILILLVLIVGIWIAIALGEYPFLSAAVWLCTLIIVFKCIL